MATDTSEREDPNISAKSPIAPAQAALPLDDNEESDEWEYEYSATEKEVRGGMHSCHIICD